MRNSSGRPLSSTSWLGVHHEAKLAERRAFAAELVDRHRPQTIVDIGCGPGLWLDLFAELLPPDALLIGIDSDEGALTEARSRSQQWAQGASFLQLDVETEPDRIPAADLYLLFNVIGFFAAPEALIHEVHRRRNPNGCMTIRQYDGDLLRVGPMSGRERQLIDSALKAAVGWSEEFHHYDLDRVIGLANGSPFATSEISFETFQRVGPFDTAFQRYLDGHLDWVESQLSDKAFDASHTWRSAVLASPDSISYFVELDVVVSLS